MNTPHLGPNIECTSTVFAYVQCVRSLGMIACLLVSLILACCMPFTAVLASAMAEGYSSDNRDPAGSGKPEVQCESTTVATLS